MNNTFDFNDLIQFGMFIIALFIGKEPWTYASSERAWEKYTIVTKSDRVLLNFFAIIHYSLNKVKPSKNIEISSYLLFNTALRKPKPSSINEKKDIL